MDAKHLRSFLAVANTLSFHRASREVHLSQPALSMQIQNLEAELDVQLFDRNRRSVRLTPAGESFRRDAEAILRQFQDATLRARMVAHGHAGHLRIAFVASAALELVPPIIVAFRKRYPKVTFDLKNVRTVDQIQGILEGTIDAGFLRLPIEQPGIHIHTVHGEPFSLVVPKEHRLASRKNFDLSDLAEENFVAYGRHWAPGFYDTWTAICHRSGFMPNVVQETAEMETMLALVAAGVGVAILPEGLANRRRSQLVVKSLAADEARSEIGLAVRQGTADPLVSNLMEIALATGNRSRASSRNESSLKLTL